MHRNVTLLILSALFLIPRVECQPILKGVFTAYSGKYKPGDSVRVYGIKVNNTDTSAYLKEQGSFIRIPAKRIRIEHNQCDFWETLWFEHSSLDIHKSGWDIKTRNDMHKQSLDYIANFKNNNLIYEDIYIEDYLLDIIKKIHPGDLNKGRRLFFTVRILNLEDNIIYALENGTILISTQLIANQPNELKLMEILAQAIAHIVLDHNIASTNLIIGDQRYRLGMIYDENKKKIAADVSKEFLRQYIKNQDPSQLFPDIKSFTGKLSNIISYTAWQEYYSQRYSESQRMIDRIINSELANEEDYLLKAKILRITGKDLTSVMEAISCIEMADSLSNHNLLDIYPEKGVLLMKAEQWDRATATLETYRTLLQTSSGMETELTWCNRMIDECRRNNK